MVLRMSNAPLSILRAHHRTATGKASQVAPEASACRCGANGIATGWIISTEAHAAGAVARGGKAASSVRVGVIELAAALAACKKHKAKLIIAKRDRLSRNLAFIATLMDSSVEFVAVDNPHANKLTIHILAAVAQHEREMIGQRTRDALKAAKARGKKLGNPKLAEARKRAVQGKESSAARYAANVLPVIREIQASGVKLTWPMSPSGLRTPAQ
jgi:DNA invertase Pin-like site-specific DNA recombinase